MRFIILFFIIITTTVNAQKEYPKDLFRPPLDIPLLLSGTFGELRSNHFHSGIDIKTQQREGLSIFSVGDGYVSRIKVSPWGFGKALYVTHANGRYTSVYAHIQKFSPEIEAYVKKLQYKKEAYDLEVFPDKNKFAIKKGELIAFSGNTGGSAGPHLHFELRDASQRPMNPLHFGMKIKDTKAPTILGLHGYSIDDKAQINQSNTPIQININKQGNATFLADKVYAIGKIGFGIHSYDNQDYTTNKNGVYAVEMSVNGTPYFSYDFEKFSFSETRYINAFIDYEKYKSEQYRVQKCFISPNNPLSIYHYKIDNGILDIKEGLQYVVEIKVRDFKGNESIINIPVEGKQLETLQKTEPAITDTFLKASVDNNYELEKASVFFPANTFYEGFYLNISKNDSTLIVHNDKIPVHKNFTINFDVSSYNEEERKKLIIARIDEEGHLVYEETSKRGTSLRTRTRNLGVYTLAMDTIAPEIIPVNFKKEKWLNDSNYLKVRIKDDFSGISDYRATINGKWILMEYEPKKDMLIYDLNDIEFEDTEHNLKIIVTDNAGNSTTFTSKLFRKN
ncbi:peptidoglycan DD-metalloendopeptidase family protein [Flavobacteriaceae bacterium R38]|nr:peptidoglycan DD-metalloendopeptidase family protein [Flavobacteriaceae bacterium R38]